ESMTTPGVAASSVVAGGGVSAGGAGGEQAARARTQIAAMNGLARSMICLSRARSIRWTGGGKMAF
ncbi:MAG: hypothetical protein ABL871_12720, partial [Terricaulis sp.]